MTDPRTVTDVALWRPLAEIRAGVKERGPAFSFMARDIVSLLALVDELSGALEMVRDADDDCHKDGLQTIPPVARYRIDQALANTISRPVMNPPAQAEAGNRVHAAPGQADRDAARRGKTAPSSRPEARPVMRTEQDRERDEELRSVAAEQYWKDKQGDEYGSY